MSEEDAKKYVVVKAKFDRHFVKYRNMMCKVQSTLERTRKSVDSFIVALVECCGYARLHDEMI